MDKDHFNVLKDPWILVENDRGQVVELSLEDLLMESGRLRCLAGESGAQNIAILRFLLAAVRSIVFKFDSEGNYDPVDDPDSREDRWVEFWQNGSFPQSAVFAYFDPFKDTFELFDEEKPFFQADRSCQEEYRYFSGGKEPKTNGKLSEIPMRKFVGSLAESANKSKWFNPRMDSLSKGLSYSESVRWLIYFQAFDDRSMKQPSPSVSYAGQLSHIYVTGRNLFETLMLNTITVSASEADLECEEEYPIWEPNPKQKDWIAGEEAYPDSLAELLTLKTRNIQLIRENGRVVRVRGAGFRNITTEKHYVHFEPYTLWERPRKEGANPVPLSYQQGSAIWLNFPLILLKEDQALQPEIITFIKNLESNNKIEGVHRIGFMTCQTNYPGSQKSSIDDQRCDEISFAPALLGNEEWTDLLNDCVDKVQKAAQIVCRYSLNLLRLQNRGEIPHQLTKGDGRKKYFSIVRMEFYSFVDPFMRSWITSLQPSNQDIDEEESNFNQKLHRLCREYIYRQSINCSEINLPANPDFYIGVEVADHENDKSSKTNTLVKNGKKTKKGQNFPWRLTIGKAQAICFKQLNDLLGKLKTDDDSANFVKDGQATDSKGDSSGK